MSTSNHFFILLSLKKNLSNQSNSDMKKSNKTISEKILNTQYPTHQNVLESFTFTKTAKPSKSSQTASQDILTDMSSESTVISAVSKPPDPTSPATANEFNLPSSV